MQGSPPGRHDWRRDSGHRQTRKGRDDRRGFGPRTLPDHVPLQVVRRRFRRRLTRTRRWDRCFRERVEFDGMDSLDPPDHRGGRRRRGPVDGQRPSVNTPVAISAITAGLGILSVLLILFRIIDPPSSGDIPDGFDISISRKIGVFLGLHRSGRGRLRGLEGNGGRGNLLPAPGRSGAEPRRWRSAAAAAAAGPVRRVRAAAGRLRPDSNQVDDGRPGIDRAAVVAFRPQRRRGESAARTMRR